MRGLFIFMLIPILAWGAEDELDQVALPLAEWDALMESIERRERHQKRKLENQVVKIAEIAEQYMALSHHGDAVDMEYQFHLEVRGEPQNLIRLPVTGFAHAMEILPNKGSIQYKENGLYFATVEPGRYKVTIRTRRPLSKEVVQTLRLSPVHAPVAKITLNIPATLKWTCTQASSIDQTEKDGLLTVDLNPNKHQPMELKFSPKINDRQDLMASASVLTLVRAGEHQVSRHDLILYEVDRGRIDHFLLDAPEDMLINHAVTDEGPVTPGYHKGALRLARKKRLEQWGHALISTTLEERGDITLPAIKPHIPLAEQYLAYASSAPAHMAPTDEHAWVRVDKDDLHPILKTAASQMNISSIWRLQSPGSPLRITLNNLSKAPQLETVVEQRHTTTVWTEDGRLVNKDRFHLLKSQTDLVMELEEDTQIWSAVVDDMPVRPVVRGKKVHIPLSFRQLNKGVVELVTLSKRAKPIPKTLASLSLPQCNAPVINHQWQLILPEGRKYRWRAGTLQNTTSGGMSLEKRVVTTRHKEARPAPLETSRFHSEAGGSHIICNVEVAGGPIPGATLTLTGNNYKRSQVTDKDGQSIFKNLKAGTYEVVVNMAGFERLTRSASVGEHAQIKLDLPLKVNADLHEFVVTAQAPVVESVKMGSFTILSEKETDDAAARDPWRVIDTIPNVTTDRINVGGSASAVSRDRAVKIDHTSFGLKPLPIVLPEEGKALYMVGVLPPKQVPVQLQIR